MIKIKIKHYGVMLLTLGLLTGCGSSSEEKTAIDFAKAISSAQLDTARKISTEKVNKEITQLEYLCLREEITTLTDLSISVLSTINESISSGKSYQELKEPTKKFEEDSDTLRQEFVQKINKQYGSIEEIPKDKKEEVEEESLIIFSKISMPLVEKEFKLFKIETKREKEVKEIVARFMRRGRLVVTYGNLNSLKKIVRKLLLKQKTKVSQQCVDTYTEYGLITDINFIELKQKAPDKAIVRLELIRKDKKTKKVSVKKVSVNVEKIQEEWKVSEL